MGFGGVGVDRGLEEEWARAVLFGQTRKESFRRDKCQHVIGLVLVVAESHGNVWVESMSAPRPCSGVGVRVMVCPRRGVGKEVW